MFQLQMLNNQYATLKVAFDQAITTGGDFTEVKKIYLELKEVERAIASRKEILGDQAKSGSFPI